MDNFYIHHVLHSLSLLEFANFDQAKSVVDIGTGGGFPGIPLAIALPEIQFHLVDSIGKKINVVNAVAEEIGLNNVRASHVRIEDLKEQFDMAVSRAVAPTKDLLVWMHQHWKGPVNMALLKGGDLSEELNEALDARPKLKFQVKSIQSKFKEPFFETKKVVLVK
jgi:16S rRNA (guanine527-N7)-methyltransferase